MSHPLECRRQVRWKGSICVADSVNSGGYACMRTNRFTQFAHQKYLNLETYRNAGKVKRIRHNRKVRIVPCDVRGNPKGEWVEAEARILDEAGAALGHTLLN